MFGACLGFDAHQYPAVIPERMRTDRRPRIDHSDN